MILHSIIQGREGQLRAGWRLAIWFAIAFAIQAAIGITVRRLDLVHEGAFLDPTRLILGDWIGTFVPVIAATVVMMKIECRKLHDYYIPTHNLFGRNFWIGTLWGLAAVSVLIGLIALFGGYRIVGIALHERVAYWVLIWITAAASIGIVEEIAFRGYMLRTLADGIGFWPAAVILSLLFGALHYFGKPHERWEDFASTGLLGLFLCFTIVRTGSLAWAMGWHFAFDWGAIFFWSGRNAGEYAPGRLFETAWPAGDHITGGLLGPEASWLVFVVIAFLFAGFQITHKQAPGTPFPLLSSFGRTGAPAPPA